MTLILHLINTFTKMNTKQANFHDELDEEIMKNSEPLMQSSCKIKKRPNNLELFLKSFKFFMWISMIIFPLVFFGKNFLNFNPLYPLFVIGLGCSVTATYYKIRMFMDPTYKPNCNCADQSFTEEAINGVLTVLEHRRATILFNIPNSVYGIFFYTFMMMITGWNMDFLDLMVKLFCSVSVLGSCWLWYIMITEVKNICILCTTIHSINFLTFYFLFF